MQILITGNMGYVGPVLVRHLRARFPDAVLIGYDSGLFAHCLTACDALPEALLDRQVFGDTRDIDAGLLGGCDAVVHLAAISNDPMGDRFAEPTDQVNHLASLRMAELARDAGVRHFVFASSCSVYGAAAPGARSEIDGVAPITAYARSKIATEHGLRQMDRGGMIVTCLRFATACGMSDRLRLDLVVNDFVACAMATGEITVLSDGSPWRPLIDVTDMARAVEWAVTRPAAPGGAMLVVNAGSDDWNFQVRGLAEAVVSQVAGSTLSINQAAPPDRRSYRVDFSLFRSLAPEHQPVATLAGTIGRLRDGLAAMGFSDRRFREGRHIRLHVLRNHAGAGRIGPDIRMRRR
ncbi:MAG: SDR family oxidoreductase [Acetobacteraceae bacterium]|jgi:nucleoside-diphosphate-sugar epimerase